MRIRPILRVQRNRRMATFQNLRMQMQKISNSQAYAIEIYNH